MVNPQSLTLRSKILGARLREARSAAGKKLKEASSAIGVSSATLSSFETGRKAISLPELELLAYQLQSPLRPFWTGKSNRPKPKVGLDPVPLIKLRQRAIAAQLRGHREEAGLSVVQLAEKVGLTASRVRSFERGDRPIPIPELETILIALGHKLDEYIDSEGTVGEWNSTERAYEALLAMPTEIRDFIAKPDNQPFLRLARRLSDLPAERLRGVAELLLDITV
jgi:transcriptional regulator with XRE-family HTH domain